MEIIILLQLMMNLNAVKALEGAGYAHKDISLISKAELVDDHIHVKSDHTVETAEVGVGVAAGRNKAPSAGKSPVQITSAS